MVADSFTYSNGALSSVGSGWGGWLAGSLTVASNAVTGTNNENRGNLRNGESWGADQSSEIQFTGSGYSNAQIAVGIHATGALNGYAWVISSSGATDIMRLDAGTPTVLASPSLGSAVAQNDTFRIQCSGATIGVYRNNSLVTSVSDNTHRSGAPAIAILQGASTEAPILDNWVGTGEVDDGVDDIIETGVESEAAAEAAAGTFVSATASDVIGSGGEAVAEAEAATGTMVATSPAIRVDDVLVDTDTGDPIDLESVELVVLGGSPGGRTIVTQSAAGEVDEGVIEIPGPYSLAAEYLVATIEDGTRMSILPATVIDRNA